MDDDKELLAWKEAHAEVYSKFKDDLERQLQMPYHQTVLNMSKGKVVEPLRSAIAFFAMMVTKKEAEVEKFFSKYIEKEDPIVMCFLYYCALDNGAERLAKALEEKTEEPDMKEIMDVIGDDESFFNHDKQQEAARIKDDELNLLALRRWHYDHPEEYALFTESFQNAYAGDMAFINNNFRLLMEMLSFSGVDDMMKNVASLVPGNKHYEQNLMSSDGNQLKARLSSILDSSLNNEAIRQQLLQRNPHIFSLYYWLVFDNGFLHAADLLSQTFLKADAPLWQQQIGQKAVESLISASIDKAHYSKAQWIEVSKKLKKGKYKSIVHSALLEEKGKRGRKNTVVLLEEMLSPETVSILVDAIEKELAEWKRFEDTDTIVPYILAALVKGEFVNGEYNYRTFHASMREKFPEHHIGKGFNWAEAVYNSIVSDDYGGNLDISETQIRRGQKYADGICQRMRKQLHSNMN